MGLTGLDFRTTGALIAAAGLAAAAAGAAGVFSCSPETPCSTRRVVGGSLLTTAGIQLIAIGLFAYAYMARWKLLARWSWAGVGWARAGDQPPVREALSVAAGALLVGLAASVALTDRWLIGGLAGLSDTRVLGVLLIAITTQFVISTTLALGTAWSISLVQQLRGPASSYVSRATSWLRTPPGVATLLTLAFVAISSWWLATDTRPPTDDAVRHLGSAVGDFTKLQVGAVTEALAEERTGEMPLLHLIGGTTMLFSGGLGVLWPTLSLNLIFVPLLAFGLYATGSMVWQNRRAGLLAVMFVFAAPMVMSQFRVFMVDAPLAALVALAVWLIVASERFERRGYTVAAGIAVGVGVMMKAVFPFYVAGLLAVVLLRGGWRNWRNLAWVAVPVALIAAPWVLKNRAELWGHVTDHLAGTQGWSVPGYQFPHRWSVDNFTYYSWSIVNHVLLLPLTTLFVVGIAVAAKDTVSGWRDRANYAPELLAGLITGYFLTSLLPLDDSRYILPLVIYAALLGTGWIVRLGRRAQIVGVAAVAAVLLANTAVQNLGIGPSANVTVAEAQPEAVSRNGEGRLTVLNPTGFNALGPPDGGAKTQEIIDASRTLGIQRASVLPGSANIFQHVSFFLDAAHMPGVRNLERLGPNEMAIKLVVPGEQMQEGDPCTQWDTGSEEFYVFRGDTRRLPAEEYEPWCPLQDR